MNPHLNDLMNAWDAQMHGHMIGDVIGTSLFLTCKYRDNCFSCIVQSHCARHCNVSYQPHSFVSLCLCVAG